MASTHTSNYPHGDLRDDESILDDDVIEADDGESQAVYEAISMLC